MVFLTTLVTVGEQSVLPSASVYEGGVHAQHWHGGAVSPESPRPGLCVTVPGRASLPHAPVLVLQLSVVPGHLPECPTCGAASPAVEGGSQGTEIRPCHTPAHRTREWWCLAGAGLVTA